MNCPMWSEARRERAPAGGTGGGPGGESGTGKFDNNKTFGDDSMISDLSGPQI